MSLVQLFFERIYWTFSWYCFQIFLYLVTIPVAPMITGMTKRFRFSEFLCLDSYILISFQYYFVLHSPLVVLLLLLLLLFNESGMHRIYECL